MKRSRTHKPPPYKPSRGRFAGRTFKSKREYRATLERSNRAKAAIARRRPVRPAEVSRKTILTQQRRADALEVLSTMRRGKLDLKAAIKDFNTYHPDSRTTAKTVMKYVRPALRRKKGQWVATLSDRLLRTMRFATPEGVIDLDIRGSGAASRIGEYWNAVKHYLATGDADQLRNFAGKWVRSGGHNYRFLTDTSALDQLAEAAEFQFDSIYEELASS